MKKYVQHDGRVVNAGSQFAHVMAIALDPRTHYHDGVIRCITHRNEDVTVLDFVDQSELHHVRGSLSEGYAIGEKIRMKNEEEILAKLRWEGQTSISLEDPDIWIDEKNDLLHLYFTLVLFSESERGKSRVHLGHAVGKTLDALEMTAPILLHDMQGGAKELSVAPVNKDGIRLNLVESAMRESDVFYSVVRVAVAEDMGKPWTFGKTVLHPKELGIPWIGGHASPGPLFSEKFITVGKGKRLGIMNGRETNRTVNGRETFGTFSVGLFVYDYEEGKIDWVSPEPLIRDSEARTITFASQFVETGRGEGILFAHVDDSFVRAYTLRAEELRSLLP